MSIEARLIVGAADMERTAVVLIPIPAGGEVEIDPVWRFLGWRDDMTINVEIEPARASIEETEDGWLVRGPDGEIVPPDVQERLDRYVGDT